MTTRHSEVADLFKSKGWDYDGTKVPMRDFSAVFHEVYGSDLPNEQVSQIICKYIICKYYVCCLLLVAFRE